jgi:hypothetical protein
VRQNIGLILLTGGSILLGFGVFRIYLTGFIKFLDWKDVPWESRLILRLFRVKQENFLKRIVEAHEKYPLGKGLKDLTLAERLYLNIPVYAIILMAMGLVLCFDYAALGRFLGSMNITKWLLTIVGCSLTILGVVLVRVGNRWLGHIDNWQAFKIRSGETSEEGLKAQRRKERWAIRFLKLSWWFLILGPMVQLIGAVMK